jgi:hypothetical protein
MTLLTFVFKTHKTYVYPLGVFILSPFFIYYINFKELFANFTVHFPDIHPPP